MEVIWRLMSIVVLRAIGAKGKTELRVQVEDVMSAELEQLLHEFMTMWREVPQDDIRDWHDTPPETDIQDFEIYKISKRMEQRDTGPKHTNNVQKINEDFNAQVESNLRGKSSLNHKTKDGRHNTQSSGYIHSLEYLRSLQSRTIRRSVPPSLYLRQKQPKRCMGSASASVFTGGNALDYMSFLVTVSTLILNINNNINNNNNNNNNNVNNNVQNSNVNTNLNSNNANQLFKPCNKLVTSYMGKVQVGFK
ncbi:hypothetical protein SK128_001361 [Halocaridina rubra]|uniref:Uncharacterized protein n=1 Tax=Halocaridina rubra TaxID=373956 RepID=A0AAN8XJL9_HALRR